MKKTTFFTLFICFTILVSAQNEKPSYTYLNKGTAVVGIGLSPVSSDMMYSFTDLSIEKGRSSYGLLLSPMFGKFVQKSWMIGAMGFVGFHSERYNYTSYRMGTGGQSLGPYNAKNVDNAFDIGLAPFSRYYFSFNRRNSFAFFLQGALPAIYSYNNSKDIIDFPSGKQEIISTYENFSLRGSIGFGLSVQGKFGSVDTHVSNMGWFFSFNKQLRLHK